MLALTRRAPGRLLGGARASSTSAGGGVADPLASGECCPRSALFVPCSNMKALQKLPGLAADAFILDLEDAVAPAKKDVARRQLVQAAAEGWLNGKHVVVRVNSIRAAPQWGRADLEAVAAIAPHVAAVGLPKAEAGDAEALAPLLAPGHRVWAFLETPRAILQAGEICASGRYAAAVMGNNDLSAELKLPMRGPAGATGVPALPPRLALHHAMSTVITAARASGMHVMDGVFNDPADAAGFAAECGEGRALGFDGKSLIHPKQIDPCHTAFTPSAEEEAWARRVVSAVEEAAGGVATVDGKMVEELHARRAAQLVALRAWSAKAAAS